MTLRVCTSSTETALMSLADYKAAAGITTTADDAIITSALSRATSLIEGYLGYPLRRQVYNESVGGFGSLELQVSRTPINAIEAIYYSTDEVDPSSYEIGNSGAGLIYRESGWPWTAGIEYDLTAHIVPKSEARLFRVVYEAGYSLNGSTADGWLTTGEAVPPDVEAALVSATTFVYRNTANQDGTVKRKQIGDLEIEYHDPTVVQESVSGLPSSIKGLLNHLRRF